MLPIPVTTIPTSTKPDTQAQYLNGYPETQAIRPLSPVPSNSVIWFSRIDIRHVLPQSITTVTISTGATIMPRVDVATIGKIASGLVGSVCVLSLLIGWLTGFAFIYPPMSVLIGGLSALFYFISATLDRQWHSDGRNR